MPRVRSDDYEAKSQAIMDCAAALFAKEGYPSAKMQDVAAACGATWLRLRGACRWWTAWRQRQRKPRSVPVWRSSRRANLRTGCVRRQQRQMRSLRHWRG